MKKIEAIIRTEKFEEVKTALERVGITGLHITEVQGRGRQRGLTHMWRGIAYGVDMLPKTKLDTVVNDEDMEKVVEAIVKAVWTGNIGDGKILSCPWRSYSGKDWRKGERCYLVRR